MTMGNSIAESMERRLYEYGHLFRNNQTGRIIFSKEENPVRNSARHQVMNLG